MTGAVACPSGRERRPVWRRVPSAEGGNRAGDVLAYRLDVIADCGAYPRVGMFLPFFTRQMAPGVYDIPKV